MLVSNISTAGICFEIVPDRERERERQRESSNICCLGTCMRNMFESNTIEHVATDTACICLVASLLIGRQLAIGIGCKLQALCMIDEGARQQQQLGFRSGNKHPRGNQQQSEPTTSSTNANDIINSSFHMAVNGSFYVACLHSMCVYLLYVGSKKKQKKTTLHNHIVAMCSTQMLKQPLKLPKNLRLTTDNIEIFVASSGVISME